MVAIFDGRRSGRINCHEHMFLEVNEETRKTTDMG
jgi:hypothetical protein